MTKIEIKKITIIWAFYIFIINTYVYLLASFNKILLSSRSIKEVCFAVWGYYWDGMHYIKIAVQGYKIPLQVFFPLYPIIIKILDFILPLTLAYRINVILLLAALVILYKLLDFLNINNNKYKILIMFLSFPTAFFLQANYTETLFVILTGLGLIFVIQQKYFIAAIFAGLLSALKISGVGLGLIVILSFLYSNSKNINSKKINFTLITQFILISIISFSGFLVYMTYLQLNFGSYKLFFELQSEWDRQFVGQNNTIFSYFQNFFIPLIESWVKNKIELTRTAGEIVCAGFAIFLGVKSYQKIPWQIWGFCVIQIIIPLASGTFMSFNRLIFAAFPLMLWGFYQIAKKRVLYIVVLGIFILYQFVNIYLFLNNVFVG